MQLTCAYQQYYLPSRNYILSHYGFDIGNCHPTVKGTLWSMSFRSGTETAAKKFYSCKGKSDEAILNTVYPTYGRNDGGRWTKSGQWGDAVSALKNDTYSIVNVVMTGSSSTPSTPSQPSTPSTSKTPYHVATSYSGGKYVGQIGAYEVLANATKAASEASQSAKKTYYVYDNTGAVVYTVEYKSSSASTGSSASKKKLYDVRVTTTDLRIRETPNGAIKGYIKPGIYGITEEKTANGIKWGHLLSSVGWIALKYTTRL